MALKCEIRIVIDYTGAFSVYRLLDGKCMSTGIIGQPWTIVHNY